MIFYRSAYALILFIFCILLNPTTLLGEPGYLSAQQETALKGKQGKRVGIIVSLKGKALITRGDGTRLLAKLKSSIYVGDRVDTGVGAQVQIDFIDHSKISLMGSSDFTVEAYKFDKSGDSQFETKVENGLIHFMSGEIGKIAPQNYKVKTELATIGIRGSSGEADISNGTIPGRPMKLEVMKKGGIGVTLAPLPPTPGAPPPPMQTVAHSGQGFAMTSPGQVVSKIFARSPSEGYDVEEKQRVRNAKRKKDSKKRGKGPKLSNDEEEREGELTEGDKTDSDLADSPEEEESSLAKASNEDADPQSTSVEDPFALEEYSALNLH